MDSHVKRMQYKKTLIAELDKTIRTKTELDWEKVAREFDSVLGGVQPPLEVANDPQAWGK